MKPQTYRRLALVTPLALLALAFFLNSVYGQRHMPRPPRPIVPKPPAFNPNPNPGMGPQIPNPGRIGPVIERVWTCSGCGKEIGRNTAFPPATCPHCGAKIINGIGPPNPTTSNPPSTPMAPGMPPTQPPGFNPNPAMPGFNPQMPGLNPNPQMPAGNPNPGMPGFNPRPNPALNNTTETVWTCSSCGKELARNTAAPPSRCPHCGAKIMNGVGPDPGPSATPVSSLFGSRSDPGTSSTTSTTSRFNGKVVALVVGIVVIGIFALLGGTFLMIYTMKSGSTAPAKRRRRPRRDDDYDY